MFRKVMIAAVLAGLAIGPAFALDQVKGKMVGSSTPAAVQANNNNAAVVDKGVSSATITVPASSEPQQFEIPLKPLIDGLMPYIISGVGTLITVIFGFLALWFKQKFNIEIEAKQREAWQQTAVNAAGALIAKGAIAVEQSGKITVHSSAMNDVISTAMLRVPAAIKALGITPEQMAQTITAKLPQVLNGAATPAPAPVNVPGRGAAIGRA